MCQVPYKHPHFKFCNYPMWSTLLVLFYTKKESQRAEVTFPRSHSKPVVELGFECKRAGIRDPHSCSLYKAGSFSAIFLIACHYLPPMLLRPVLKGGFTKDSIYLPCHAHSPYPNGRALAPEWGSQRAFTKSMGLCGQFQSDDILWPEG